ncbi:MAG: thiamine pyrophosphate-dependent enzyme [Candidatus Nealsonbacteria bacterium]|nr:thiamine pyrophosphate-dependent enzyme [Candidatus Nealsonbacteria bacterium]
MFENILQNKTEKKVILLGNEAIIRGALEVGVDFVSTYPGTPASEIGDIFFKLSQSKDYKGYFEFSTNEKVALEAGIGASFSGLKTLVAMKNFGANVALDALIPFVYTGSKGPTVILVADDPSCHSSAQSEENSRGLAYLAHIPILEPSDPQECKDFVKLAFQISEKFKIPVIIRTTTRVAHQRALVKLEKIKIGRAAGFFKKDPKKFVTLPPRVLEMKKELLEKIEKIREFSEKSEINRRINRGRVSISSKVGIITSGVSYLYVMEVLKEFNLKLPLLKLGFFYPLSEKKIQNFIKNLKKVLIAEELEPYLEKEVERLAKEVNCKLEIIGKKLLPEVGELRPEIVASAIAKFTNDKLKIENFALQNFCKTKTWESDKLKIPRRSPRLCPGCPYWLVISAIKKVLRHGSGQAVKDVIFGGEIGCYMLFGTLAVNMQDYLSCMGSSVGIAHGIQKATGQKLITFVGDSSFFHSGIPALINTVFNKSNPLIIILENQTTAMTGHQPHPGAPVFPNGIKIENIVQACGVKHFKVIDPINQKEFVDTVKSFLEKPEVSVIISRRPCIQIKK